jgi:hypothetical protein
LPDVPGYELLRELGRGGMGVVYLARDLKLPRHVVLKMILSNAPLTESQRARFRAEAEVVAGLQHPHVVAIYAAGEHEGQPYLALEYLPGGSLDRQIQGSPQPPLVAAHLVELLARAVRFEFQNNELGVFLSIAGRSKKLRGQSEKKRPGPKAARGWRVCRLSKVFTALPSRRYRNVAGICLARNPCRAA